MNICETGYSNLTFTIVEQKIPLEYLEAYLRYSNFVQTTVNIYETGHSSLTFTTVEQKIALEYLEAYLRYSNFALNSLF